MRRIKLVLEYNGAGFHGWQVQPDVVTVQGTLEACLLRLTRDTVRLHAAGRTDSGVHALGQVAHFDTTSGLALPTLQRGLNSLTPPSLVVRHVAEVAPDFHARYSARQKSYAYIIRNQSLQSAFHYPFSWHVRQPLDLDAMRQAAHELIGRHDFSAFRAASCSARDAVRQISHLAVKRRATQIYVVIRADGFLQYMVRNIVGTLVEMGLGRLPATGMGAILRSGQRQQAGPTAPPHGLFLVRVRYDNQSV